MKKNIVKFIVIGGITTLIDFCIYMAVNNFLDISVAKFCSMLIASLFSYYFNKKWTFENSEKTDVFYLMKYYTTFIINMSVNISINRIAYNYSRNKMIAFVIGTGFAMIINFLLQKFWVFRKENKSK